MLLARFWERPVGLPLLGLELVPSLVRVGMVLAPSLIFNGLDMASCLFVLFVLFSFIFGLAETFLVTCVVCVTCVVRGVFCRPGDL